MQVLDRGSVELMSHSPDGDLLVVNAARCSFDKEHDTFDYVKDTKLIKYLAKHGHVLPFRHPSATLRIFAPLFVLRQLGKHQVGFSWSEVSRRYVKSIPSFYEPTMLRGNPDNVKQGSSDKVIHSLESKIDISESYHQALSLYRSLLEKGVCAEQARIVLPQAMYTTTVTTGTLLGWHHMVKMRTEEHTQRETQEYAIEIARIMRRLFPVSWEALCQH